MQIQSANDLLDSSVEEVPPQLAKNPSTFVPTNPNEQQKVNVGDNEKFVFLKKTVLSKPKTPKEIVTEKAQKRRQKRKVELEKKTK